MTRDELREMGERISTRRKQLHLTQEQIAEKMNVSIQMVSNLERGNKAIKIENLIKISKILDISTDYILLGNHNEKDIDTVVENISRLPEKDYKMIELLIEYCLKTDAGFQTTDIR